MKKYLYLSVLLFSCGSETNIEECHDISFDTNKFEVVGKIWNKEKILVCWNTRNIIDEDKKLIQSLVTDAWDKNVSIDFVGWNECDNIKRDGIDLFISDDSSKFDSKFTAIAFQGMPETLPSFIFIDYSDLKSNEQHFKRSILHEFGHILNLSHEHQRKDTPEWCDDWNEGRGYSTNSEDTSHFGPWDLYSIMNYCSGPLITAPSCLDLQEVAFIYGNE